MSKLGELVELCHELNGEDFSVFFDYSGHIRRFALSLHMGGWVSGDQRIEFGCFKEVDKAGDAIEWIKQKHEENKLFLTDRAEQAAQNAKALEEAKALLTPEQIKIIKELA